jgi:signal transduction histidine kinase
MTLKAILALLQIAILAAGLALLGALVVESFDRTLRADADALLAARVDAIESTVRGLAQSGDNAPTLEDIDPNTSGFEAFSQPRLFVEVWDGEGRLVVRSPGLPPNGLPWSTDFWAALSRGDSLIESIRVENGPRVRVISRPIFEADRLIAVVRVGESLQAIDRAVSDLMRTLTFGGLLVLLACIIATWLVVSRALEPFESIAATAERIAVTGDVSLTVEPRGTAEVKRVAIAFNRMVERLQRLLETQRQLLADTSHELRNPLTVIRTDLSLLGRDVDPEIRQEVAAEAEEEAERMTRLVGDLLFLAREEQSALGPAEHVRLDLLVDEVVERLQQVAPEHAVWLRQADAATVPGNRDRLHQLVTNLIENGIRYTPAGGHVTVDVTLTEGGTARLDVIDDGVGIAPEHLSRVFDRFYRVDPARGRSTGGTGLGLAIVKHVAESHGGSVSTISDPGVGSTFTVTLPAVEPSALPSPPMSAGSPSRSSDPDSPGVPAAAPSGHAADSLPVETRSTPDRPAHRP